jgi:hypothetical protein
VRRRPLAVVRCPGIRLPLERFVMCVLLPEVSEGLSLKARFSFPAERQVWATE